MSLFPRYEFLLYFIEKMIEIISILAHLFAIIFAQDVFFFTKISSTCTADQFGTTRAWLNLEIFVFYFTFLANFMFLLGSEFLSKKSGLEF